MTVAAADTNLQRKRNLISLGSERETCNISAFHS